MQTLIHQLEALLFAAGRSLSIAELTDLSGHPAEDVHVALDTLAHQLSGRGIRLVRSHTGAELATSPEASKIVEAFLQQESTTPLSKPALETLAIITHNQPVTKYEIEEIRGIASEQTLKSLVGRGLIEEVGRSKAAGRSPQYGVTTTFLRQVGAASINELRGDAD